MRNRNKEAQFEQPSDILIIINRYLVIILAIMVVGILALGYFFFLQPKVQAINLVRQEDTETQEKKLQNEKLLNRVKELENEFNNIKNNRRKDLDKLKSILPNDPLIAELFVLADSLANSHGFDLNSIDISEDTSSSATSPAAADPSAPPLDNSQDYANASSASPVLEKQDVLPVKSLIVHLSISKAGAEEGQKEAGNLDVYGDFKAYIDDLEKNLRLMDIIGISFGELTQANAGIKTGFNLDIITYFRDNGQKQ